MELRLEVYDSSLNLLGMLEICKSVVWEAQAFGAGSFQLESILTDETRELLREDNIIWIAGEDHGIIEHIAMEAGEDGINNITVKGRLLSSILDRRVLWGTYKITSGRPGAVMANFVNTSCVEVSRGTAALRKIPGLVIGSVDTSGSSIRCNRTGGTVLEAVSGIGEAYQVAYGIDFNHTSGQMEFWARKGVNRTINQSAVEAVFFSTELDDVIASEYAYDGADFRNVAYVGGQIDDETDTRQYVTIEGTAAGLARRELFVDARDCSKVNEDQTVMSDSEYAQVLQQRGQSKLGEHPRSESFEVTCKTRDTTYEYGVDFFLGDTITITDERLGLTVDAIVTAVQRSMTRDGETLTFTFGYSAPTVYDKLRKAVG